MHVDAERRLLQRGLVEAMRVDDLQYELEIRDEGDGERVMVRRPRNAPRIIQLPPTTGA